MNAQHQVNPQWLARFGRAALCALIGLVGAWLYHLGHVDPTYSGWDDPQLWLHTLEEGILAFGIGGSAFLISGAALRYRAAARRRLARRASLDPTPNRQYTGD